MAEISLRTGIFFWVPAAAHFAATWAWDRQREQLRRMHEAAAPRALPLRQTGELASRESEPARSQVSDGQTPAGAHQQVVRRAELRTDAAQREQGAEIDAAKLLAQAPAKDWAKLVEHVERRALRRFVGETAEASQERERQVTTAASGAQDREVIPGLQDTDYEDDEELHFLDIDLKKTWMDGAVGAERTRDARDRSGALERLVVTRDDALGDGLAEAEEPLWGRQVLGEMQVCFVLVLTIANYSCLEQWKRVLGLVMTCRTAVARREAFFAEFLRVLHLQLKHCDDVEGGLFELADAGSGNYLKELLRGFRRVLQDELDENEGDRVKRAMKDLEDWLAEAWSWELSDSFVRRGTLQLEDGENVELEMDDLTAEDERGEFAPMIVEL